MPSSYSKWKLHKIAFWTSNICCIMHIINFGCPSIEGWFLNTSRCYLRDFQTPPTPTPMLAGVRVLIRCQFTLSKWQYGLNLYIKRRVHCKMKISGNVKVCLLMLPVIIFLPKHISKSSTTDRSYSKWMGVSADWMGSYSTPGQNKSRKCCQKMWEQFWTK